MTCQTEVADGCWTTYHGNLRCPEGLEKEPPVEGQVDSPKEANRAVETETTAIARGIEEAAKPEAEQEVHAAMTLEEVRELRQRLEKAERELANRDDK